MIERIKIINFQSLHDVDLELGQFTVIVGASSTGKSAIVRALKAVTSNALDSDYITRGAKKAAVSLKTNNATVTIQRELGGSSVYKIAKTGSEESRYPKLNRQVPAEVAATLGIISSTQEINFAGQFDPPYLLTEKGSTVASILGELTNVSTIFAAVKEASRRAKNASSLLNIRKKDKVEVVNSLKEYTDLSYRANTISEVSKSLSEAETLEKSMIVLSELIFNITKYSQATTQISTVPDIAQTVHSYSRLTEFKKYLKSAIIAQRQVTESLKSIDTLDTELQSIDHKIHSLLKEAGSCPTCNRRI